MERTKLYITLYITAITALLFYVLFPSDEVADYVSHHAASLLPGIAVEIDDAKPALPPGIHLKKTRLLIHATDLPLAEIKKAGKMLLKKKAQGIYPPDINLVEIDFSGRIFF